MPIKKASSESQDKSKQVKAKSRVSPDNLKNTASTPSPRRTNTHYRIDPDTVVALNNIAIALGYRHGDSGAVGKMLDAIAQNRIILVVVKPPKK